MTDLSTWWKNLPDTSTPLEASTLNAWGADLEGVLDAAVDARNEAQAFAEQAGAPSDDVVAELVLTPLTSQSATSTALDARYPRRGTAALDRLHAVLASSAMRPVHVVVAGDSYIQGLDATRASLRFVNRLADRLRAAYPSGGPSETPVRRWSDEGYAAPYTLPGVHVVNAGVGGTASDAYLTTMTLEQIGTLGAAVVFHVIGTNDLATTPPTDVATYKANVLAKVTTIATTLPDCVHVLVHGALRPDAPWHADIWQQYGNALAQLAEENPATVTYADISAPFTAAEVPGADPYSLMTEGGIHPNDAGHALMADEAARVLAVTGVVPPTWFGVDTFSRPNSASLGSAETRQAWTVIGSAAYSVVGGKAKPTTAGIVTIDAVRTDVEVACTVTYGAALAGVVVRCSSDGANYLAVVLAGAKLTVYKSVGGVVNEVGTPFVVAHTAGVDYQLRVSVVGAAVVIYRDGIPVATYTITDSALLSTSRVGLYSGSGLTMLFDDFGVRPV